MKVVVKERVWKKEGKKGKEAQFVKKAGKDKKWFIQQVRALEERRKWNDE